MKLQKGLTAVLLGGAFVLTACKCERKGEYAVDNTATETAVSAQENEGQTGSNLDENGNFVYNVGANTDITLPDGTKMTVGENSTENKLFGMINNPEFKVSDDKTQGWVTLDRVYFETGKAELTESSKAQIANIITLLKAFPDVKVKMGGYTDNTGAEDVNMRVSGERAATVAKMLTDGGVDSARVASEGYGANHFVCEANDTDECRAQNRRVDIRITQK